MGDFELPLGVSLYSHLMSGVPCMASGSTISQAPQDSGVSDAYPWTWIVGLHSGWDAGPSPGSVLIYKFTLINT